MSVHLVAGADPVLRDDAAATLIGELLDGENRSLAVEELTVPARGEGEDAGVEGREGVVAAAVLAASSPPFMTAQRIVVVREVGNLRAGDLGPLTAYLDDPLPTTELVLVAGGGKTPDALDKWVQAPTARSPPLPPSAASTS